MTEFNFEDLTVGQLRKLTEQFEGLLKENKILKVKYPTRAAKLKELPTAEDLLRDLQ